jgi:hypothetical protein
MKEDYMEVAAPSNSEETSDDPVTQCGSGLLDADMEYSRIVILMGASGRAFWRRRLLG